MAQDVIAPLLDKGAYIGIGALVVWAIKSGWLERMMTRIGLVRKEIQAEAKEGPEREIKLLRESIEEYRLTQKGIIAELTEQRDKRHNCEVEVAEIRSELKHEREQKEELKKEIAELRKQIQSEVGEWKLIKQDVAAVQQEQLDHQDQHNKK